MKTVIIFGATGTVGVYAALHFKEAGYAVIAVGHRKTDNGFFLDYGIDYYSVDITALEDFKKLPLKVDAVIHLAGMLPARMKGYNPQKYIDINVTGTLNVLNYAVSAHAAKIVYSQSISDVAHLCGSEKKILADEISRFPLNNDHSVYSITKNAAVGLIEHFSAKYGFEYFILRFPNIYLYHPNPMYYVDGEERWQGYRKMIDMAQKGENLTIWGDPTKKRDIVYVKDCTQIIEKCISSPLAESGTYNVGTGIGTSMEDQVRGIAKVFCPEGKSIEILYDKTKPDSSEYIFDISKTIEKLGYTPQYKYIDYLLDFKKEYESKRFKKIWGE